MGSGIVAGGSSWPPWGPSEGAGAGWGARSWRAIEGAMPKRMPPERLPSAIPERCRRRGCHRRCPSGHFPGPSVPEAPPPPESMPRGGIRGLRPFAASDDTITSAASRGAAAVQCSVLKCGHGLCRPVSRPEGCRLHEGGRTTDVLRQGLAGPVAAPARVPLSGGPDDDLSPRARPGTRPPPRASRHDHGRPRDHRSSCNCAASRRSTLTSYAPARHQGGMDFEGSPVQVRA
jgi:hypothetical protein